MRQPELKKRPLSSESVIDLTDGDLVIEVTAKAPEDSAREVVAVQPIQEALQVSYRSLANGLVTEFENVALLEEVSKRRVTLWMRVHVRPDRGRSAFARVPAGVILKFLSQATLAMLEWLNAASHLPLRDLQRSIRVLAEGALPRSTHPGYCSSADLMEAITAWQKAKASLSFGDEARVFTQHGSIQLDLTKAPSLPAGLVGKKVVNHDADIIFIVELPDYRGTGEWQLKHGGAHVTATCAPGTLLERFYRRELDIRPGDALHCRVEFETSYGPDFEVVEERFRILEVLEVLTTRGDRAAVEGREEAPDRAKTEHRDDIFALEG